MSERSLDFDKHPNVPSRIEPRKPITLPESATQELAAGNGSEQLFSKERVAHRFARQLAKEYRVDADLYRDAESIFGQKGLVDMIYLIGIYLLMAAMLNVFEIPSPE